MWLYAFSRFEFARRRSPLLPPAARSFPFSPPARRDVAVDIRRCAADEQAPGKICRTRGANRCFRRVREHSYSHMVARSRTVGELRNVLPLFQFLYQVLSFGMIVSSALMIWKGLMVITGSESPIVVVLRYEREKPNLGAHTANIYLYIFIYMLYIHTLSILYDIRVQIW